MSEPSDYRDRNCVDCTCRSEMFNKLAKEELEFVFQNKATILYRKGEIIRKQGTAMTHVISVTSGLVKVYLEGPEKKHTIVRIVKPTNFIGGPGIFLDQVHHYSVSALLDTMVCFIDMKAFRKVLEQNKSFSEEFMKDYSRKVLLVYQRLINLTHKEVPGRMAETLLYLSDSVFNSDHFEMYLTKQDLADISGMSKDSCLKILREFQKEGIIFLKNNQLQLLKPEILKRIANFG